MNITHQKYFKMRTLLNLIIKQLLPYSFAFPLWWKFHVGSPFRLSCLIGTISVSVGLPLFHVSGDQFQEIRYGEVLYKTREPYDEYNNNKLGHGTA